MEAQVVSPSPFIHLDSSCLPVDNTEIFRIYTERASNPTTKESTGHSGGRLGYIDAHQSLLEIEFEVNPEELPVLTLEETAAVRPRNARHHRGRVKKGKEVVKAVAVCVTVAQDLGALRNRKGDTGSVVWRATVLLAQRLLQQSLFPSPHPPLFPLPALSSIRVLELGSGTGVLPLLLQTPLPGHPSGMFKSWTATDQLDNLKLIQKNVGLNKCVGVTVEELDWTELPRGKDVGEYDVIVAVDCLYNEALVGPFVKTLELFCRPGTVFLICAELRSSDVLELFIDTLLDAFSDVYSLGTSAVGAELIPENGYICWVGWKRVGVV